MAEREIRQGDVFWYDFGPARGSAPADRRPCVIVQNDTYNRSLIGRTLVCAITSNLARANDQWQHFDGREALVIFQGPHAYISPSWYTEHPSVPTWNYTAVHVYGTPTVIDDEAIIRTMLTELVANHEQGRDPEWPMQLPDDYYQKMRQAIIVFEIPITQIEGKFKLSQNRSEADVHSVINHLESSSSPLDNETARLMADQRRGS